MALVIKKEVDLSSLGEEYKDVKITFKVIPASKLPEIYSLSQEGQAKDKEAEGKGIELIPKFTEVLKEQFESGSSPGGSMTKDDIDVLDGGAIVHCFTILSGGGLDPKGKNSLTSPSTTDQPQQ